MDIKLQFYVLFLSRKLLTHTFLLQIQSTHTFCCKNDLSTLVLLQKQFTHTFFVAKTIYAFFFVAKMIYALRPESFCALEVAIRKVQTFWASGWQWWSWLRWLWSRKHVILTLQEDEEIRRQIVKEGVFYHTYKDFPLKETEELWSTEWTWTLSTSLYFAKLHITCSILRMKYVET